MIEPPSIYPRFRNYYRSLVPLFEKPKVAAYTMLVLSFFTMAIFGIFAIRPTLATIVQLKKHIDDQKVVDSRMDDKITKLRKAEIEYKNVQPALEAIFEALPTRPQSAALLGKLNSTLVANNIDVTILQISSIELSTNTASSSAMVTTTPLGFSLTGRASYNDLLAFIDLLYRMDRIITIDSVDIAKPQATQGAPQADLLTISIRGKSYTLPENMPASKAGKGNKDG